MTSSVLHADRKQGGSLARFTSAEFVVLFPLSTTPNPTSGSLRQPLNRLHPMNFGFQHPTLQTQSMGELTPHLVQSRLKIDVTPNIAYTGYTPWNELPSSNRCNINSSRPDTPTKQRYSKKLPSEKIYRLAMIMRE